MILIMIGFFVALLIAPSFCSRNYSSLICHPGTRYCSSEIGKDPNDTVSIYTCNKQGSNWTSTPCSKHLADSSCSMSPEWFSAICLRKCTPGYHYCASELTDMGYEKIQSLHANSLYNCQNAYEVTLNSTCLGSCVPEPLSMSLCIQACEPGLDYCGHELNSLENWDKSYLNDGLYHCDLEKSVWLIRNCTTKCEASTNNSFCSFENYSGICSSRAARSRVKRVQNGAKAEVGQWPWMASLRRNGNHVCGGTLIGSSWILTAAHCFVDHLADDIEIVLGNTSPQRYAKGELRLKTNEIYIPEGFDNHTSNDIGLLYLTTPLEFSRQIQPLCLSESAVNETDDCMIAGWGRTKSESEVSVLQEGKVSIMTAQESRTKYKATFRGRYKENQFTPNIIFAGERSVLYTGACKGDSGGPLMCRNKEGKWYGVGITSFSSIFACKSAANIFLLPAGYTRISAYYSWIENITGITMNSNINSNLNSTGSRPSIRTFFFCFVILLLNLAI